MTLLNSVLGSLATVVRERMNLLRDAMQQAELRELWERMFVNLLQSDIESGAACYKLFRPVCEALPSKAATFLPALRRLYQQLGPQSGMVCLCLVHLTESPFQLLDRRNLLQLCVYLGSETFIREMLPLVLEAVLCSSSLSEIAVESVIWCVICFRMAMTKLLGCQNGMAP